MTGLSSLSGLRVGAEAEQVDWSQMADLGRRVLFHVAANK